MKDYNVEQLRTYFKENNIDDKTRQILLENNPFNGKNLKWERDYKKTNRILAFAIKNKKLINKDTNIKEITAIGDFSISKFFRFVENNCINFKKETVVLARDTLYCNDSYLNNLIKNTPHFILGICTKDYKAYKVKKELYKKITEKNKNIELIECNTDGYNVCIVRK